MSDLQVTIPEMCKTHQALLVKQCGYAPADPWRALMIVTQVALFQGLTADPKVHAELGGRIEDVAKIGCMACRKPDLFGVLIDKVQKTFPRRHHIRAIKELGESWVANAK